MVMGSVVEVMEINGRGNLGLGGEERLRGRDGGRNGGKEGFSGSERNGER